MELCFCYCCNFLDNIVLFVIIYKLLKYILFVKKLKIIIEVDVNLYEDNVIMIYIVYFFL